jgi:hypothetical protein
MELIAMSDMELIELDQVDARLAESSMVDSDFDELEPVEIREYMNSYEENDYAFG